MKEKNAWKLVKHEDYEVCEHEWRISSASDQYVYAECGEETGCENYVGEEWDVVGMCEECYDKSQMPEKEREITEQIEGLQKKLIDIQKVE
jgi:hypothetical protein